MDKFYGVMSIECEYRFQDKTSFWNARVLVTVPFIDSEYYSLEGPLKFENEKAYLIGISGFGNNELCFSMLLEDNKIIDYSLLLDEKDKSYYGCWHIIDKKNTIFGGYAKIKLLENDLAFPIICKRIEKIGHEYFYPKYSTIISCFLLSKNPTINNYSKEYLQKIYNFSKKHFEQDKVYSENNIIKTLYKRKTHF